MDTIKTALIVVLSIIIVLLTTCNSCNKKEDSGQPIIKTKSDTVYRIDTMITVIRNPVPYEVTKTEKKIEWKFDTLFIEGLPTDIDSLVQDYFATRKYDTTIKTDYGELQLKQTVSENKLLTDTIIPSFTIPTITHTITETKTEQKAILYLGVDGYANNKTLNGGGVSLMLKTKRSLAYELGTYWNEQTKINYRASIKIPLSLNLKK